MHMPWRTRARSTGGAPAEREGFRFKAGHVHFGRGVPAKRSAHMAGGGRARPAGRPQPQL
jgi:hypothetical protein